MDLRDTIRTYRLFSGLMTLFLGRYFIPDARKPCASPTTGRVSAFSRSGSAPGCRCPISARIRASPASTSRPRCWKRRAAGSSANNCATSTALHVMDAEHLEFEDNSFDSVLALYVASVVPDPARFAAEMRRVCIPGGTIVLVNHFTSDNWALRWMERRLAHLARHIGFHADFPLDNFLATAGSRSARSGRAICSAIGGCCAASTKSPPRPWLECAVGRVERSATRHFGPD